MSFAVVSLELVLPWQNFLSETCGSRFDRYDPGFA